MKHLILFSFLISFIQPQAITREVSSIKIIKTNFDMTIIARLECDNFLKFSDLDTFYVTDEKQIKKIASLIHKAKPTTKFDSVDTRAKMYIYYKSGFVDSLCFGSTTVFSLNNTINLLPDRELVEILEQFKK